MLLPLLIHTKPLKINIPPGTKLRLNRSRYVNGTLDIEFLDTTFHNTKLERNHPRHLNRTAKGNFAVALAKVQVADAEFSTRHMDGEVDFGAAGEVLDVAVSAVFGAARDGAGAFLADFGF